MDVKARDAEYIASTYKRFPVELVGGQGAELVDDTGKKYIDLGSGIAVNLFGMDKEGQDYRACAAYGPLYKKY